MLIRIDGKSSEDRAYCQIMDMIMSQELAPGAPIMETALADRLGMSRTPVRTAIRRLASSGLLEMASNKSTIIPHLTRRDYDDLFDLRLMVEPRIAELATVKYRGERNDFFRELLEDESRGKGRDGHSMQELNERLHFTIAELAGNVYMRRALQQVFWRCQLYVCFFDSFVASGREREKRLENPAEVRSMSHHEEIVSAVVNNDPERAGSVMRAHIKATYDRAATFGSVKYFL